MGASKNSGFFSKTRRGLVEKRSILKYVSIAGKTATPYWSKRRIFEVPI